MNLLVISILEIIYLLYMFLFFKTSIDFNIFSSSENWWFEHLVGKEYGLRICPFGRIAIFVLIFVLIARNYINIPNYILNIVLITSFLFSLMNMNAIAYLIPIWLIEIFIKIRGCLVC